MDKMGAAGLRGAFGVGWISGAKGKCKIAEISIEYMQEFDATIKTINQLEFSSFKIPDYQRPYVWTIKETRQLWDDIINSEKQQRKDYRIGTIILHNNKELSSLDIVDGQQRLTTLSLLMYLLNDKQGPLPCIDFLKQKQFVHKDSVDNIRSNAAEIKEWISDELTQPDKLLNYILHCCSMVTIEVLDISAAFQMFDSQNGRGLPLEPYNLLKAYHLRYFENISQNDKITFDRKWEASAKNKEKRDYLKQVIGEQLYRTRIWSKNFPAFEFTKTAITEFKGTPISYLQYPYQNFVNHLVENKKDKDIPRISNEKLGTNTQINQPIVNGTSFFKYIDNYVAIYKLLFESTNTCDELSTYYTFYNDYCKGFKKKGDYYLLELYKSMIMLVYDKYGYVGLMRTYKLLYAFVFRFRLEKKFVKYNSVAQFPSEVIAKIQHSKELLDLNFIKEKAWADIERQENNENNQIVECFFKKHTKVKIY